MGSIQMPHDVQDVLIVGAGPVGLALGLDLGYRGIRATILERKPGTGLQFEAKASVLNERTMEYCRRLGVRDDVANAGYPADLPGDTVYCTSLNDKYIGRLEMPSYEERDLPPESSEMLQRCPQVWFDPVLAKAVLKQGMANIQYNTELTSFSHDDEGVTCQVTDLQDGSVKQIRTKYLVACDGPASIVRKQSGIAFEGKDLGHTLSAIIDVKVNGANPPFGRPAERYMFIGTDGTWGNFTTIDGRDLWRFSVVGMEGKVDKDTFDMHSLVNKALGRDDVTYDLKRVLQWRRSQYTANAYTVGQRIFLAGDAAHTMSPTGGHGLNTGLGDASDLSWMLQALLEGWGGPNLQQAYVTERRPIAIRNGLGSTKNFKVWKNDQGRDKVHDEGAAADEQRRNIGESMAATMRQEFQAIGLALGYDYSSSPLVIPDGTEAPRNEPETYIQTARPGHRAPHVWLAEGQSTIDLFGRGFVLLCFGDESVDDRRIINAATKLTMPFELVKIDNAEAASLYERRLVLVRPDGMVAWRGDALPADVGQVLDRVRGVSVAAELN